MLRYTNINRIIRQCRYLIDHKRPRVQILGYKQPKYIYQQRYLADAAPALDNAFQQHPHRNQFSQLGYQKQQIMRYRYPSQWWQDGFFSKALAAVMPLIIWFVLAIKNQQNKKFNRQTRINAQVPDGLSYQGTVPLLDLR